MAATFDPSCELISKFKSFTKYLHISISCLFIANNKGFTINLSPIVNLSQFVG